MRRSGRTQVKLLVPPQRIDFGQGKRRSSGGIALGDQSGGGHRGGGLLQHPVVALLAQLLARRAVLAQEAGQRLLGRVGARAALDCAAGGDHAARRPPPARCGAGR